MWSRVSSVSQRRELSRLPTRGAARMLVTMLAFLTALLVSAAARAETRTLSFYYTHTQESLTVTYKRGGQYDPEGLKKLNAFLRDWRRGTPTRMDPQLFDILWEVYRASGSSQPIHIISAYRSPETNGMLRARSRGVAQFSQHTLGKAMDFRLPDVPISKIRELGLKLQAGGVGFYPGSNFVHLDTGSVRHWPRMTRMQLAKLFPDGKTIHLPSDGRPLEGYQLALAERGRGRRTLGGAGTQIAAAGQSGGNVLTRLFGGADQSEDEAEARAPAARPGTQETAVAAASSPAGSRSPLQVASAEGAPGAAALPPLPRPRPAFLNAPALEAEEEQEGEAEAPSVVAARSPSDVLGAFLARESQEGAARSSALATLALAMPRPALAAAVPAALADAQAPERAATAAVLPLPKRRPPAALPPVAAEGAEDHLRTVAPDGWTSPALLSAEAVAANAGLAGLNHPTPDFGALSRPAAAVIPIRFGRIGSAGPRHDGFQGSAVIRVPTLVFAQADSALFTRH